MLSRTCNYSGFQSYGDKPVPALKPGQQSQSQNYYSAVTAEPKEMYLTNYNRLTSNYQSTMGGLIPADVVQQKRAPVFDKSGKPNYGPAPPEKRPENPQLTSHWGSVYHNEFVHKQGARAERPEWSKHRAPHQVRMPPEFYWAKNK